MNIAVRRLVRPASTPPAAINAGWTEREVIEHDANTRAMNPSSVTSIR